VNARTTANGFHGLIATTFFGILSTSFAALPAAADSLGPPTVTVKYADLNLSNPRDAAVLYGRIDTAAEDICSPYDHTGSLSSKMRVKTCVNKVVEDAVIKTKEPALIAVYSAKTGKTLAPRVASAPTG
jgi:UrcA family protein